MGSVNKSLVNFARLSGSSYSSKVLIGQPIDGTNYHVIAKQYDPSTGFGAQASFNPVARGYAESARPFLHSLLQIARDRDLKKGRFDQ
ncbi:MAG: hypothetical protein Q9M41_11620 [Paracoccaceae bacterium]|nr:hypothetical protein [Paracoccaceae bacterium]